MSSNKTMDDWPFGIKITGGTVPISAPPKSVKCWRAETSRGYLVIKTLTNNYWAKHSKSGCPSWSRMEMMQTDSALLADAFGLLRCACGAAKRER